ncbi:MAG: dual specificity protein phosphatase family protein [Chloroflexota bacterium]|nr:dual specificity protein phosphatase family protein [Chloroflexota bacterium]
MTQPAEPQVKNEPMELEKKGTLADLLKQLSSLWYGIVDQGFWVSFLGLSEFFMRFITGAPIQRLSQITPQLHISGQHQGRGWKTLSKRGITAMVNMRTEFDDQAAGIAPPRYMHLKILDNTPPTLEHLQAGSDFIAQEIKQGGKVYIHCAAGVGRAPTMAAAYLVSTGYSPSEAWKQIRKVRPFIRPTPAQIAQVDAFAEKVRAAPVTEAVPAATDMALEKSAVNIEAPVSTVPVETDVPVVAVPPVGSEKAEQSGMPSTVGSAPAPITPVESDAPSSEAATQSPPDTASAGTGSSNEGGNTIKPETANDEKKQKP